MHYVYVRSSMSSLDSRLSRLHRPFRLSRLLQLFVSRIGRLEPILMHVLHRLQRYGHGRISRSRRCSHTSTSSTETLRPKKVFFWTTREQSQWWDLDDHVEADRSNRSNFIVWSTAALNRHYLVALASLMVLLCLTLQPLAAALLVVRSAWMPIHSEPKPLLGSYSRINVMGARPNIEYPAASRP